MNSNIITKGELDNISKSDGLIVLENDSKYSYNDFLNAKEKLWEAVYNGDIDLIGSGLRQKSNCLYVEAKEWDDAKEQQVSKITGIDMDNLIFEVSQGFGEYDSTPTDKDENSFVQSTGYDLNDARPGDLITKDNMEYTIGTGIYYKLKHGGGSGYGWLTAGHHVKPGDKFYMSNYYMGKAKYVNCGPFRGNTSAWIDATIIKKDANTKVDFSMELPDGKVLLNTGEAIEGDKVKLAGGVSGIKSGIVTDANYDTYWPGDDGREVRYKLMIKTNIVSQKGDSGSPLLKLTSKGSGYSVIGILKGLKNGESSVYTSWEQLEGDMVANPDSSDSDDFETIKIYLWP